ncbi:MAG: AMP-binding protein, partial [Actinomycetota bacterium]
MHVPLTIRDHLDRATTVYPSRIGVIDEPDAPGGGLGEITYGRIGELATAQAAALDELGIDRGERVAILSQNAARMLVSFFGVSGWGRVLVPINFRLNSSEIAYIVEHSGASVLLYDPEMADAIVGLDVKHTLELSAATDSQLYKLGTTPEEWTAPDE